MLVCVRMRVTCDICGGRGALTQNVMHITFAHAQTSLVSAFVALLAVCVGLPNRSEASSKVRVHTLVQTHTQTLKHAHTRRRQCICICHQLPYPPRTTRPINSFRTCT